METGRAEGQTKGDRVRYQIIIAGTQPGLYKHLKQTFAGDKTVEVILDRRRGERRKRVERYGPDRRRADRRLQPRIYDKLPLGGMMVIRRQHQENSGRKATRTGAGPLGLIQRDTTATDSPPQVTRTR